MANILFGGWLGAAVMVVTGYSFLDWQWWFVIIPAAMFFIYLKEE